MFGPIWWFFFQDFEPAQWTIYLPAAADWDEYEPDLGLVNEVQE